MEVQHNRTLIINSVLHTLFKTTTPFLSTIIYDDEKNNVTHPHHYSSGNAYAHAYIFAEYLTRCVDLCFDTSDICMLYLTVSDKIETELIIGRFWDEQMKEPNINVLYVIADSICNMLNTQPLVRLPYTELNTLFDKLKKVDNIEYQHDIKSNNIEYGEKYCDDEYQYRIITLSQEAYKVMKMRYRSGIVDEDACYVLGINQSSEWVHIFSDTYCENLVFRRPIPHAK